jgi:hypothetical protein
MGILKFGFVKFKLNEMLPDLIKAKKILDEIILKMQSNNVELFMYNNILHKRKVVDGIVYWSFFDTDNEWKLYYTNSNLNLEKIYNSKGRMHCIGNNMIELIEVTL